jgi:hypothetical protein
MQEPRTGMAAACPTHIAQHRADPSCDDFHILRRSTDKQWRRRSAQGSSAQASGCVEPCSVMNVGNQSSTVCSSWSRPPAILHPLHISVQSNPKNNKPSFPWAALHLLLIWKRLYPPTPTSSTPV